MFFSIFSFFTFLGLIMTRCYFFIMMENLWFLNEIGFRQIRNGPIIQTRRILYDLLLAIKYSHKKTNDCDNLI